MAIIFVTGANQGLGYALLSRLGKETTGHTLLLGARSVEKGEAAVKSLADEGVKAELVLIDLVDDESIQKAADTISTKYGKVDVLVNNAAILYVGKPSVREEMRTIFETNVFSLPVILDAFKPLLVKSDIKKVVNLSSGVGSLENTVKKVYGVFPLTYVSYPTTKPALNMITLHYLQNWADTGIKFVLIDPGHVATGLNKYSGPKTPYQGSEAAFTAITTDDWENGDFLRKEPGEDKLTRVPW